MHFDARAAKQLQPDQHLTVADCPGLRLVATKTTKSWTYRYKSPVDGRMKQTKIGEWPAMSPATATVAWEKLREARNEGQEPVAKSRQSSKAPNGDMVPQTSKYTVGILCRDYLEGHVERNRKTKGAKEIARMFRTMLGPLADAAADGLTRAQAFDLLESHAHIPVQAAKLRAELGAAWEYAHDAGRLSQDVPNWWRLIMRGKLKSKGKSIGGKRVGKKRTLTDAELTVLIPWLPNFSRSVCDVLTLYLWTATRGAEIVSMEGREVTEESDGWWWTIPKEKTKNERHEDATDLRVPLIGRAEVVVRRRLSVYGKGYLFPPANGSAAHIEQKVVQTAVHYHQPYSRTRPEMVRPRLPVTVWAPHDLRRTIRTMLASMGCPDEVGEAVIGHMQEGIKGVYNRHAYDAERRVWLTRVSERLEQLAGGR
ncbi:tyrosine-type recombinase/integrase [Paraburkholderia dioscoreae]|uniref:Integrase n=1 Tax=Paraburkholderia dioscoreae TaxID=2604047 RepID=A0A5Q4ZHA6_9BURK|nr:integrase family protein [Paraburkholderia dioscoreae]VVD29214.1 Integrase [Paraburkholderia dioscoreae]